MKKLKKLLAYAVAFALGIFISTAFSWSIYVSTSILALWCIKTVIDDIKED